MPPDLNYGEFTVVLPPEEHSCSDEEIWSRSCDIWREIQRDLRDGKYRVKSFTAVIHNSKIKLIKQEVEVGGMTVVRKLKAD
jgi:hypothetical protein